MSDFILARVSQTLATEQSLETLVRQLLEMLEAVTRMESTYLTRIDTNAQRQQVSLIFIDLDGFKAINDRFGHPCGDSFLVQVGKRLTAVARREDLVGRLGGDEFLIVGSAQQPAAQQAYVTSLRQALCGVYFLGEQRIDYEGASFGVVTCDPQSIDVEAALRAADEAMYQDKKSRRQENFIHID